MSRADIQGEWKIDNSLTTKFNNRFSRMSAEQEALIKCYSENSIFKISGDRFFLSVKGGVCPVNGNEILIDDYETEYKFEKIFENNSLVALMSKDEEDSEFVEIIHKVNDDLLWIYNSGGEPDYDSHVRYYFKKIHKDVNTKD